MAVSESKPVPVGERPHLKFLDGLRALAALAVVVCHSWLEVWPIVTQPTYHPSAMAWGQVLVYAGHFAVDLFIVLSGFCLMLPVVRGDGTLRGGSWGFYKRRARRLLPPYYFALAFSLLLIWTLVGRKTGTHWDAALPVTFGGLMAHLTLLQNWFDPGQINHAYWSVAVEWWIYALFPLLVFAWRRIGVTATILWTFLAAYSACLLLQHTRFLAVTPDYLFLFILGMVGAEIAFGSFGAGASARRFPWLAGGIALLFIVYGSALFHDQIQKIWFHTYKLDLLVGAASMMFIVAGCRSPQGAFCRALSWQPLFFVGTFAYSIYLVHAPLIQVIWQYVLHPLHLAPVSTFLWLVFAGMPLMVGVAFLFFLACERPFLNTKKHETLAESGLEAIKSPAP
jgi:peptidoglycan/LPS O-acetylase OafA/YrhL